MLSVSHDFEEHDFVDGFDADTEMETLLLLMRRNISRGKAQMQAHERKRSTLQNNTDIPPPVRFTRKNQNSARNGRGQAQVAMASTSFHEPSSAQLPTCSLPNATKQPFTSDYDKIYAALLLDDDCPDTLPSAEALNTLIDV
jgi:hypothetical protein